MVGRVTKNKMDKSVVVECVSYRSHGLYGKYIKTRKRYHAHDEHNAYQIGDEVEIQEHRPLSKTKRFMVTRLVKKFVKE
nr:30S ribosomal protein S17 [Pajaroellobacter abortibovis]